METDDQTTRRRQRAARLQSPGDTHGSWRHKKGRNMACGESSTVCAAEGEESQRGRKKAKHRHWPPLKKLGFTEMKWWIVREMRHKENASQVTTHSHGHTNVSLTVSLSQTLSSPSLAVAGGVRVSSPSLVSSSSAQPSRSRSRSNQHSPWFGRRRLLADWPHRRLLLAGSVFESPR
ncbi:hypothetical protein PIB30_057363 [Stylosanthes scabra]|uniref:Uncharacterized protein n=1 Tax=Stylosanthes scabra TaxID=79078 RepID=A0ABU6ZID8_9FABA|nr:hypothetical protein [Stylosanthes scabra]